MDLEDVLLEEQLAAEDFGAAVHKPYGGIRASYLPNDRMAVWRNSNNGNLITTRKWKIGEMELSNVPHFYFSLSRKMILL